MAISTNASLTHQRQRATTSTKKRVPITSTPTVESRILTIRGQKVILDSDLAAIYGVTTKRLNEQVKRNMKRFPPDFLFQLTATEYAALRTHDAGLAPEDTQVTLNRSQIATGSRKHRNPRLRPYAFTENGAIMAANVLNSPEAVRMSVFVVRAFLQMRELLSGSHELAAELKKLEATLTARLDVHETAIVNVLRRIMELMDAPSAPVLPEKSMGFHTTIKLPTNAPKQQSQNLNQKSSRI